MTSDPSEYLSIEQYYFPNQGYILTTAPTLVLNEIQATINDIMTKQVNPVEYNKRLAGQIRHEYKMEFSQQAESMIEFICNEYHRKFNTLGTPNKLLGSWINMQTKHEFNPLHNHDGQLSWVIWVTIPYKLQDELAMFSQAKGQEASMFGFVYQEILGQIRTHLLPVDQDWQGRMAIFPAKLGHFVHPFYTSDGVRISVAGNMG